MLLKEIRYVLAINTYGSMAKASERLYISQPALSKYIQNLEDSLDITLFNRSNGRLQLTYYGERYISAASKMLDIFEQLENELHDVKDAKKGRIRIGVSTFRGPFLLPRIIADFHTEHPGIEIDIHEHGAATLEQMLIRGELDIIIVNLPLTQPGIEYISILEEELLLTVPKNHPANSLAVTFPGKTYKWMDIKHFAHDSFILLKKGLKTREIANALLKEVAFAPVGLIETANIDTAYRLSAHGFGISIVPETYALNSSSEEKANLYSIGFPDTRITLAVAYKKDTYLSKANEIFLQQVLAYYQSNTKNKV